MQHIFHYAFMFQRQRQSYKMGALLMSPFLFSDFSVILNH